MINQTISVREIAAEEGERSIGTNAADRLCVLQTDIAYDSILTMEIKPGEIGHIIQLAIAPVFLLTGVGTNMLVLTNRLARIIDRTRLLEENLTERIAVDLSRVGADSLRPTGRSAGKTNNEGTQ